MINKLGGFSPEYHSENNLIAYCGKDLSHCVAKIGGSGHFFIERFAKMSFVELANTFIDEILASPHQGTFQNDQQIMDSILAKVLIKFP
jgi:hypothetical protein